MSGAGVSLDIDRLLGLRHVAARMRQPRPAALGAAAGPLGLRRRGRGLEPHDVRPWSEGDDLRALDRNATARTGVPHVRTYREERERSVLLLADFRPSMLFGTRRALRSVAAGEALALLGWRVVAEGGRVGLAACAENGLRGAGFARGARGMIAAIGTLAAAHDAAMETRASTDPPLAPLIEEAERLAPRGAAMVVASALDAPGAAFAATVERLARRRRLAVLLVADAFERAPAAGNYPYRTATGAAGWFRIGRDAGEAARNRIEQRLAALRRMGASAALLGADLDIADICGVVERLGV